LLPQRAIRSFMEGREIVNRQRLGRPDRKNSLLRSPGIQIGHGFRGKKLPCWTEWPILLVSWIAQALPKRISDPGPATLAVPEQSLGHGPANLPRWVAQEFRQGFNQQAIVDVGQSIDRGSPDNRLSGSAGHLKNEIDLALPPICPEFQS